MVLKLKAAKAHAALLQDPARKGEFESLENAFASKDFALQEGTVNAIILGADYVNYEKKLEVAVALANVTGKSINEIHAKLILELMGVDAKVAVTTMNLNSEFLGVVDNQEAVFVNMKIPVKGLNEDRSFSSAQYSGRLDDVRITFVEQD